MATILVIGLIKVVCTLYTIVTFPIYYIVQMPWKKRSLSARVKVRSSVVDLNSVRIYLV